VNRDYYKANVVLTSLPLCHISEIGGMLVLRDYSATLDKFQQHNVQPICERLPISNGLQFRQTIVWHSSKSKRVFSACYFLGGWL